MTTPSVTNPPRVCVLGAGGRLGQAILRRLPKQVTFAAAFEGSATGGVGLVRTREPAALPGVIYTSDPARALEGVAVAIDFTAPAAAAALLPLCAQRGVAYVLGSTGLSAEDEAAIQLASATIPVVVASNFSVGVNVLCDLVEAAARALGESFDVELHELHHRRKRDAPSGTALTLAEAVARGRGRMDLVRGRAGHEKERDAAQLGLAASRGGDVAGEHTLYFLGEGERLELTHRATTPEIFADGALRAAAWVLGKPPGRYHMRDVLR